MDKNVGLNTKILKNVEFNKIILTYQNDKSEFDLTFKIRKTSIAQRWANKVNFAKSIYPIDNPSRFYGFGSKKSQISDAIEKINRSCKTINSHEKIINKTLTKIDDYDTLNYLHHIFEVYHGLLDQQTHPFYLSASQEVRKALADLNVLVHLCETVSRVNDKRQVITYYGLPKTECLDINDYKLFESDFRSGVIYLVYCEIGKTLKDLAIDNDQYIHPDSYKPFRYFSADFEIYFTNTNPDDSVKIKKMIEDYYKKNYQFFISRGLSIDHPYNTFGKLPVADIEVIPENMLELLASHQFTKKVTLL